MAIENFWGNLTNAFNSYRTKPTSSPQSDAGRWLDTMSVDEFEPKDFQFLEEAQQTALAESVENFLAVARQVPRRNPPTPAQIEEGQAAFEKILHILQPDKYSDIESLRVELLLKRDLRGELPKWVTGISCETETDSLGDPAIRIRIDVTDKAVDQGKIEKQGLSILDAVRDAYRRTRGRRWPYVSFRSPDAFAQK